MEKTLEGRDVTIQGLRYDLHQYQTQEASFNVSFPPSPIPQVVNHYIELPENDIDSNGGNSISVIPDDNVIRGQNLRDRIRGTNLYDWRQRVRPMQGQPEQQGRGREG